MAATVVELEEVQSHLKMRDGELITMRNARTKVAAELEQLRTRTASTSSESVGVHSAARDDERPAIGAKGGRDSKSRIRAPSTATYSAVLAERE